MYLPRSIRTYLSSHPRLSSHLDHVSSLYTHYSQPSYRKWHSTLLVLLYVLGAIGLALWMKGNFHDDEEEIAKPIRGEKGYVEPSQEERDEKTRKGKRESQYPRLFRTPPAETSATATTTTTKKVDTPLPPPKVDVFWDLTDPSTRPSDVPISTVTSEIRSTAGSLPRTDPSKAQKQPEVVVKAYVPKGAKANEDKAELVKDGVEVVEVPEGSSKVRSRLFFFSWRIISS